MAIIYSYENNNELLRSDKLVGTAATLYNGKFRRITKNFTLGQLSDFINLQFTNNIEEWVTDNFVPKVRTLSINDVTYDLSANRSWTIDTGGQNLQEVTDIGNVTTNPILIPQLQLYDTSNDAYSSINYSDGQFNLYDTDGRLIKVFEKNGLEETKNQNDFTLLKNVTLLTANRTRTEPNKDGTYAMLDDILPSAWKEPAELLLLNADVVQGGGLPQISGLTIQGYTLVQGSRVVVTEYNVPAFNGIYRVAAGPLIPTGNYTLVRTNDANSGNELNNAVIGITNGTFSGKTYRQTTANPVINTTAINFVDFAVTSVGMTVPSAFNVTPSTITSSGTFAITGAGSVSQYVRGDGSLANFPASSGGGASVSYYLNGSISQGTIGGVAYKEMNSVPVIGAGTDFTINTNGYIAQFITDAGDPNKLLIPGGNWNFETYFSASSGGGSPRFYIELYKYDGSVFTLIASNSASPKLINDGTSIEAYFSALAVPPTTLLATDRLAVRFYVINSGRTITMHTENSHLCQVITTFSTGLTALNGLTQQVQYFAVGTSGIDFNISSVTDTHTFNLPTASAINRGALSSADWTTFNNKLNSASPSYTGLMTGVGTTQTGSSAIGVVDLSQTWNTTGTPTAIKLNVTNTASNANSLLMDLQVGGISQFRVDALGQVTQTRRLAINNTIISAHANVNVGNQNIIDIGASTATNNISSTINGFTYRINQNPTSGNAQFNGFAYSGTINQTGGANGITRGLFINPTLTSAFDFRAIETTVGNVILGSTSGNVGIGTTSPQARLDLRAQGALSTDIAFRVRNSADTANLLEVAGNGSTLLNGLQTLQGTVASDTAPLGTELLTTGTGDASWTGTSFATGYTHIVGSVTTLTSTLAAVIGVFYQITYTVTGRTAGSFTIAFGGSSTAGITATGAVGPLASTTGTLVITPTTDFDGTIVLSIRTIGTSSATTTFRSSNGTASNEIRVSNVISNTFIGLNAGTRNTTGGSNTAIGISALRNNTTGNNNTANGANSLQNNTGGSNNTASGIEALLSNTTANNNSAFGFQALRSNTTGFQNTANGQGSLRLNTTGSFNTASGSLALTSNTTGTNNTASGLAALQNNTTGDGNTAIGASILQNNTTGSSNTAVGAAALFNNITGSNNTAYGLSAGRNLQDGTANTTPNNSVFLGTNTRALADNQTNQIVIGHDAIGIGSNSVVLGNSSIIRTVLRGQTSVNTDTVNASAQLQIESTTRGFLLPRMTTAQRDAIVSPAVGLQIFNTSVGYLEYFDSFWGWMPIDNSNDWKRRNGTEYFNDFGQNNSFSDGVFQTFPLNGGGALTFSPIPNTNNYIGFQGLSTGVNTNGANSIRTDVNSGSFFNFNCGRKSFTSRIWVLALSDVTNRYNILNGFSNGNNSTVSSGAAFIYDEGGVGTGTTASPNWQIITANGGVRTNFVTSVPVNITTWYSFKIETNANDTEVYYYINDVLVRTETTNIPGVGVANIQPYISITKNTGTTTRGIAVDYLGLKIKLNNQR